MARESHNLNRQDIAQLQPAEESGEEVLHRLRREGKKVKSPAEIRKESAQKAADKMHKAETLFISAKAQFEALKRSLDVKQKYGVDIARSEREKVESAESAMLKAKFDFEAAQRAHTTHSRDIEKMAKKAKITDIVSRAQKKLEEPELTESAPSSTEPAEIKPAKTADELLDEIINEAEVKDTEARMKERVFDDFETPKDYATKLAHKDKDVEEVIEDYVADVENVAPRKGVRTSSQTNRGQTMRGEFHVNAHLQKEVEQGRVVLQRLNEIAKELKTLGYDVEAQVIKPPFWGSLTKKGRLILEFIKLSDDKNYQALLKAQEDSRRKPGAENDNRETARAMSYRAGGVVSRRGAEPTEDMSTRAKRDEYELRKENKGKHYSDQLEHTERINEGEKVEKVLEQINEELAVFGLTAPDLLTIDRKTAKIVTNAGTDIKKLRKEYLELVEDPNFKYYLNHKK